MAKRNRRGRSNQKTQARAKDIREAVNEGVALQVELLSAAVKIWSTVFESMAAYSKATNIELMNFSGSGDANAALDRIIKAGRDKLKKLTELPKEIGEKFPDRVRARAKS